MSSQAVAKRDDTAVTAWDGIDDIAWESDGSEEIRISFPVIHLVQGTSKFEGSGKHGGEFWHTDREEYEPELNVVALQMSYGQAFFEDGKAGPSCSSSDGRIPRPSQPLWQQETWRPRNGEPLPVPSIQQPQTCDVCPFNQWGANNTPPICKRSILLLVEREDGSFAQFRFGGKSLKPFQQFVSKRLVHKNRRLPLFVMRLRLYSSEEHDDQNKWYELHVEGEPLPSAEIRHYNALVGEMRGALSRAVEEADQADPEARPATDWNDDGANLVPDGDGFEE